jgi:transglutaminase-like putative cysteine protease
MSMEKKRPQLNLDELHQLKWLLGGALALLSAWSVPYLDVNAWPLMLALTVLVPMMWLRPDWAARWPAWAHWLVFPAVVLFFAGDLYLTGEVLPAFVRLTLLLLIYRGTSLRQRRDDLQLIVLGLLLIVVAGVLTVSLAFAVQILAFTACALVFMLIITLVGAKEAGGKTFKSGKSENVPAWTRVRWRPLFARLRAVMDWRVAALGPALFLGVVGVSALLFLTFPRFELANSMFLDRLITRHTRSGFSDTIRFSDVTDITQDTSVALRVEVPDPAKLPAELYWRMIVLDEYHNSEFRASAVLRNQAVYYLNQSFVPGNEHGGGAGVWTFYLEPGVSRYLPLTGGFATLKLGTPTDLRFDNVTQAIVLLRDPATMTAYRVTGMRIADTLPDAVPEMGMRSLGAMSESDQAALRKLAGEIDGGVHLGATEFAQRATAWLAQRHGYALQTQLPAGAGDPLVRWLRSPAPGHCELFAGALVMLARAANHPARVVAGFEGGDWNGFENYLMVRNSDAHAWCEVYDDTARAWQRVDPTPGATGTVNTPAALAEPLALRASARSWAARLDSLRILWYRHIVNFDQRSQRETMLAVKNATEQIGLRLSAAAGRLVAAVRAWLNAPWNPRRAAKISAVAAGTVAVLVAARRARWRLRWRLGATGRADPVRREAGRLLRRLANRGFRTEANADLAGVRAELQRLRYGARETWPSSGAVLRRARRLARRRGT